MHKFSSTQTVFARRLKEARLNAGIPQDRLGVMIGLDEGCSSARMSRYETGVHEPPFPIIIKIADVLNVPVAYFFCGDDRLAEMMRAYFLADEDNRQAMREAVIALGT